MPLVKYRISFGIREITSWWQKKDKGNVLEKSFESRKSAFDILTLIYQKLAYRQTRFVQLKIYHYLSLSVFTGTVPYRRRDIRKV